MDYRDTLPTRDARAPLGLEEGLQLASLGRSEPKLVLLQLSIFDQE